MNYPSKLSSALAMLATTGLSRSSYEPPLYRLLWRVGLLLPPPHFASFGFNFVCIETSTQSAQGEAADVLPKVAGPRAGHFVFVAFYGRDRNHARAISLGAPCIQIAYLGTMLAMARAAREWHNGFAKYQPIKSS